MKQRTVFKSYCLGERAIVIGVRRIEEEIRPASELLFSGAE
jgi:hypothetical protein